MSASEPVGVVVVDDHAVVRQGINAYVAELPDVRIVGEAANGEQALATIEALVAAGTPPRVVLMDLMMPVLDGVAATKAIKDRFPGVEVIVMTSFSEPERVRSALEVGAAGYLLKDADPAEVHKAILAALSGELHLNTAVARQLTTSMLSHDAAAESLSPREREVLSLVGLGYSNRAIAETLVISERTARTHVSSILFKLDLASRTQAALWAIKHGIAVLPS